MISSGALNVLKPPGMTSHDVVACLRRILGLKRVGHAGTLDPAAAGVLPVFFGNATRLIEYSTESSKTYRAQLTFGYETDTGDDTGNILCRETFNMPSSEVILPVLKSFLGNSQQVPPMYSAIKMGGKKLYEYARLGQVIERQPRKICIDNIELLDVASETIMFDVSCSKGTYIRTLCADIGKKLNIPAVMSFLIRTRVGSFILAESLTLEEIEQNPELAVIAPDKTILHIPKVYLSSAESIFFQQGKCIYNDESPCGLLRIYDNMDYFIGIGNKLNEINMIKPIKVMPRA